MSYQNKDTTDEVNRELSEGLLSEWDETDSSIHSEHHSRHRVCRSCEKVE